MLDLPDLPAIDNKLLLTEEGAVKPGLRDMFDYHILTDQQWGLLEAL